MPKYESPSKVAGMMNGPGHLFSYNEIKDHKMALNSLRKRHTKLQREETKFEMTSALVI